MWWFSKNGSNPGHLPEATGEFVPGCMDVMLDYSPEGIFMRLYYPTNRNKNDINNSSRWIPWMPPGNGYIVGLAKVLMLFPFIIRFAKWWSANLVPVIYGSRPKVDRKLKCIVFSHGLGGHRSLYTNIFCELASRGYLIAATEHKGGSACYSYYYKCKEDAEKDIKTHVEYEPFQLGKNHFKQRKRQVDIRANECSKALDFLINLNRGVVPHNVINDVTVEKVEFGLEDLVGNLDLDSLTMAGHSFGGATALLTLSQRQEFKQGILLDPWMYPIKDYHLDTKLHQPLLFINTQTFHIETNVQAMSKYLTDNNQRSMYTLLRTTHEHQGDTVLLFGSWLNWFMAKADPVIALRINNSLILQFLDKCVGSPSDVSDCKEFLEEHNSEFEAGLTKPWA